MNNFSDPYYIYSNISESVLVSHLRTRYKI